MNEDIREKHDIYTDKKVYDLIEQMQSLRKDAQLSQRELSEIMGVSSHTNIVTMEQHKTIPRLDRFIKILSILGYSIEIVKK